MGFKLENDEALDLLMDRIRSFIKRNTFEGLTQDEMDKITKLERIEERLYEEMYKSALENGYFDEGDNSISEIVDNDYINYCSFIEPDDDEKYNEIIKTIINDEPEYMSDLNKDCSNGYLDLSCQLHYCIEQAYKDSDNNYYFLIRL